MRASTLLFVAVTSTIASAQSDIPLSPKFDALIDQIQNNASLYTYPTSLTQGIIPKNIHSHNDYWRPLPFYSALSVGAVSVEADVWLYNETLHVGHEESALTSGRTLDSLYIQPILRVLQDQNPNSTYVPAGQAKHGVFDTSSGQTLYLFVDVKTDGPTTWPYVVRALQPLQDAGYLTTFNGTSVTSGAVTVIGTGNTPLNQVQGISPRHYFYDAHLQLLNSTESNVTSNDSPIASTSFASQFGEIRNGSMNDTQLAKLRGQISLATSRGIGVRYWDQPLWPIGNRNAIWKLLWDEGVSLINSDDLAGSADFWQINQ